MNESLRHLITANGGDPDELLLHAQGKHDQDAHGRHRGGGAGGAGASDEITWTAQKPVTTTGAKSGPLLNKVIETPGHRPERANTEMTSGQNRTYQNMSKMIVTEERIINGNHQVSGYMATSSGGALYRVNRHTVGANQPVIIHGTAQKKPKPKEPESDQGSLF